jgi:hypothetical protein
VNAEAHFPIYAIYVATYFWKTLYAVAIIIVVASAIPFRQLLPYLFWEILDATGDIAFYYASIIFTHAIVIRHHDRTLAKRDGKLTI